MMWAMTKLTVEALQTDQAMNGIPLYLSPTQVGNQTMYYPQGIETASHHYVDRTGMYQNTAFFMYLFLCIGVGLSFAIGMAVSLSGQLNPLFTFAMAMLGAQKWKNVLPCVLGQVLGDVAGSAMFYSMIMHQTRSDHWLDGLVDFKTMSYARIFYVMPRDTSPGDLTNGQAFWNSLFMSSTMVLVIVPVFASPQKLHRAVEPLVIGTIVTCSVMGTYGLGVSNNPAQYLGGTIFCWLAGWPASELWHHDDNYLATAVFAPLLGAVLACFGLKIYFTMLYHHPSTWLNELTSTLEAAWHGLIPVHWANVKIKTYRATQEPHTPLHTPHHTPLHTPRNEPEHARLSASSLDDSTSHEV